MKILVIKLSALGDLFHALPAVHALKVGLGGEIHWVTQPEYRGVVDCFPDVDRVLLFPRRRVVSRLRGFLAELRAEQYDIVVDFQGLLKSAFVCGFARAKRRIGPSFHREFAHLAYSEVAGERNKNRHAVDENLDVIRHLGLPCDGEIAFPVKFPSAGRDEPRPRVAVLPASRWPSKNWPAACFADTLSRISKRRNISVFLIGRASDRGLCSEVADRMGDGAVNLAGEMALAQTGGLLREMDLLIANDSGPVHMAAAVRTPSLVVFGPTDPTRTGPYGDVHRVVTASLPCSPCFSRTCGQPGIPCLSGVTPERVAEVALEMLSPEAGVPTSASTRHRS